MSSKTPIDSQVADDQADSEKCSNEGMPKRIASSKTKYLAWILLWFLSLLGISLLGYAVGRTHNNGAELSRIKAELKEKNARIAELNQISILRKELENQLKSLINQAISDQTQSLMTVLNTQTGTLKTNLIEKEFVKLRGMIESLVSKADRQDIGMRLTLENLHKISTSVEETRYRTELIFKRVMTLGDDPH